jgi:hypothetical protein
MSYMLVFIVTTGSYSDYAIEAVFSDRGEAEKAAHDVGGEVAVFEVHDEVPPKFMLHVKECLRGTVGERSSVHNGWEDPESLYMGGRLRRGLGFHEWRDGKWQNYRYWGRDYDRVHRAFDDYHAQRLAAEQLA